jgi:uncharacterized protein YjcR
MANKKEREREHAKILYLKENCTFKEVAERVGVSERTVSRWATEGKWDDLKTSLLTTKEDELRRLYAQLKELNTAIESKPEGKRYSDSKEADIFSKITASIRQLETETSVAQIVEVSRQMAEWLRAVDLEKAKQFVSWADAFIKTKLK